MSISIERVACASTTRASGPAPSAARATPQYASSSAQSRFHVHAVWSLSQYFSSGRALDLVFGLVSLAAGVGLIIYGKYVFNKLKKID